MRRVAYLLYFSKKREALVALVCNDDEQNRNLRARKGTSRLSA